MNQRRAISPATLLCLLFMAWWAVNLFQAAFTELANDEAYYYICYSIRPAWGYFDHPPMTGWLIWLGTHIFGATPLGIRFFFTILQPLYLLVFFHTIRPKEYTTRDVALYAMVSAALPVLQLYGFIAVPDGPLLLFAALFLWSYKRFEEHNRMTDVLLMGLTAALLGYSKYHGALVVAFVVLSNPKLLKNPRLYVAAMIAAGLMIPHLWWEYTHGWVSFKYHLSMRNRAFEAGYVGEYLLNLLAIFNPLFWPIYVRAWRKCKPRDLYERAIYVKGLGLIVFFLLSSLRGYVQPQWVIASSFACILLLFNYGRIYPRTRRYLMWVGWVTLGLVALVRIEMVFNPLGVKFEIFDNKTTYGAIAEKAAGRPVVFSGNYAIAAKYMYYTGGEAYCQPDLHYRSSQWQFMDNDIRMAGREVLAQVQDSLAEQTLSLANGRRFSYVVIPSFYPVRMVEVSPVQPLPHEVQTGQTLDIAVKITNPYDYPIELDPDSTALVLVWNIQKKRITDEYTMRDAVRTLPPHGVICDTVHFTLPREVLQGKYTVGFAVRRSPLQYWYNGPVSKVKVEAK